MIMKAKLFLLTLLAFATATLLAFRFNDNSPASYKQQKKRTAGRTAIGCSPDWSQLTEWMEEVNIPPMPGAGTHKWKISTTSDSAQFYFNQGINMYYGFHIIEAMASFKKAAKFDPNCAMIYWAQALAYGPNINDLGYAASPDALAAIKKAKKSDDRCTKKEKSLIEAQAKRYSADSTISREKLNQAYVDEMKDAYDEFGDDADVAALYADALMLQHPWDLWKTDGTPKEWTPRIRQVLEKLLAKYPNHPGANHYYIHVMEPSPFAAKALPSADRLGTISPGLSHLVHMPSHIYLRTGFYEKGTLVNEAAVNSYKKYISLYAPVTGNDFLYIIHNLHMQANNAMLDGRLTYSMQSAAATVNSIPKDYLALEGPLGSYLQYIYMTPLLVNVRFGTWADLLDYPQPAASMRYANVLWHFGRGMAFTGQAKLSEATTELKQMRELMKDSSLYVPLSPFSPAIDGALVAEGLLAGSIAVAQKKYDEAIQLFSRAVTTEENIVYNEPRDWMLNPKHYLGNAYLKAGRFKDAEKAFQKDLENNAENAWALRGLYQAQAGQLKKEAAGIMVRFRKASARSDVQITNAVF
jgi:tetratricopeptide (TPR) repeat protein